MIRGKKIVYGICGIGRGHSIRQLPVITALSHYNQIIIFAFGESYDFYESIFSGHQNVSIKQVVVPWYVGSRDGIDFRKTAAVTTNDQSSYFANNMAVLDEVSQQFGKPDLVISDYEPTAAQLSYAMGVPLLTIDQQSKFLSGNYPILGENSALSESARLNMFFPSAKKRIACSFFKVARADDGPAVEIVPPILRGNVVKMREEGVVPDEKLILVYLSPYSTFVQPESEILEIFSSITSHTFHLYVSRKTKYMDFKHHADNVHIYYHGDPNYEKSMQAMSGAISTAGHSFLSEMMFLGRPTFAIPLDTYEQAYNAKMIADHGFGISDSRITKTNVEYFIRNISKFKAAIEHDTSILNRRDGLEAVLQHVEDAVVTSNKTTSLI